MNWRQLVAIAGAMLCATTVPAQSTLGGTVRERGSSSAVQDAEILIERLGVRLFSDAKGRFRVDSIPAGRYVVLVRRLGFDSASASIAFTGDDDVKEDFELVRLAQPLPAVPVTGKEAPISNPKVAQFEERKKFGIGRFLTAADLERDQDRLLSNVVQRLPGLTVIMPGRAGRYGGGLSAFVASSRGAVSLRSAGLFGSKCPLAIWLDGAVVYRGGNDVPFDINQIATRHIEAMEVYVGQAQIPAEFNATMGTCGALVIWTK